MQESDDLPTAILAFDDSVTRHMVTAAQVNGLSIPEDISIMGVGNNEFEARKGEWATVVVDFERMAQMSVQRLIERIQNEGLTGITIPIHATKFKPGTSIARPRQTLQNIDQ